MMTPLVAGIEADVLVQPIQVRGRKVDRCDNLGPAKQGGNRKGAGITKNSRPFYQWPRAEPGLGSDDDP